MPRRVRREQVQDAEVLTFSERLVLQKLLGDFTEIGSVCLLILVVPLTIYLCHLSDDWVESALPASLAPWLSALGPVLVFAACLFNAIVANSLWLVFVAFTRIQPTSVITQPLTLSIERHRTSILGLTVYVHRRRMYWGDIHTISIETVEHWFYGRAPRLVIQLDNTKRVTTAMPHSDEVNTWLQGHLRQLLEQRAPGSPDDVPDAVQHLLDPHTGSSVDDGLDADG